METSWFYLNGGERQGPVTLEELVRAILMAPDPGRVLVWNTGMADWQEAGAVPEVSRMLPPPRPQFQPQPASPPVPFDQAEAIARLYRRLVLLVGLQLLLGFLRVPMAISTSSVANALLILSVLILLAVLAALAVTAHQLTQNLGDSVPVIWAVAMFLPCINIIVLLILSSKATAWCQRYGIRVGFLGPTKESIDELRRRGATSHFD